MRRPTIYRAAPVAGLIVAATVIGACNRAGGDAAGGVGGASGPAANGTVSGTVLKMADGADLTWVRNIEKVHPQFYLTPPEVDSALIFAVVRTETENGVPVILKKTGGAGGAGGLAVATRPASQPGAIGAGWRIMQVMEAAKQEWVYAAACPARGEVWAVLDTAGDVKGWQLTLLRSTDGGATWAFYAAVKKPANGAVYAGFALAANGTGRLTMHLEDDVDGHAHGYYHFRTADGGKTWTGPTVEGNDVSEADPMGADDTLQDAIKNTE